MTPNPKPKPITGEDTQQFSADDVKQAGIKRYSSPRNQQQQQQPNQNVAVQITALIVLLVFVLALLAAGTIITLNIVH